MKLAKRFLALFAAIWLMLGAGWAMAAATEERVFDSAGLFTADQKQSIRTAIADFQKTTGMDFVVLTSSKDHGSTTTAQIADDYYDQYGFGLDAEHSGALYYIDLATREEYLSTTGAMIDYITDSRLENALDASNPNLKLGRYADAALAMLTKVKQFVQAGIPEGQYRYDVLTGQRLTARHNALTSTEMLVGGALCLAVGLVFIGVVKGRYKLKGSTYRYQYANNADVDMTETRDDYLRTTVTRTRKAPPPGAGGGRGFGGGGGSGVHIGGGGVSHGGGGRGF